MRRGGQETTFVELPFRAILGPRFDMVSTFANASNDRWLLHLNPAKEKPGETWRQATAEVSSIFETTSAASDRGRQFCEGPRLYPLANLARAQFCSEEILGQSLRRRLSLQSTTSGQRSAQSQHLRVRRRAGSTSVSISYPLHFFSETASLNLRKTQPGGIR